MTDLEITKLCGSAMSYECTEWSEFNHPLHGGIAAWTSPESDAPPFNFNPLHDDAQAMALVKKFRLDITSAGLDSWECWKSGLTPEVNNWGRNVDLNRAICECVAKMQSSAK